MSSFTRLVLVGYVLGLVLLLCVLLLPSSSQAQLGFQQIGPSNFGVSSGFRATPGLPTIVIPVLNASASGFGGSVGGNGGILGAGGGGAAGGSVSGSISTSLVSIDLGSFFPNHGQIIGLPPPTLMPPLNNQLYDSTGAPWALLLVGGGGGAGGGGIGAVGGVGGGVAGAGGIGAGGFGGQIGGGGVGGGFAGKGLGGFNGKKPL